MEAARIRFPTVEANISEPASQRKHFVELDTNERYKNCSFTMCVIKAILYSDTAWHCETKNFKVSNGQAITYKCPLPSQSEVKLRRTGRFLEDACFSTIRFIRATSYSEYFPHRTSKLSTDAVVLLQQYLHSFKFPAVASRLLFSQPEKTLQIYCFLPLWILPDIR